LKLLPDKDMLGLNWYFKPRLIIKLVLVQLVEHSICKAYYPWEKKLTYLFQITIYFEQLTIVGIYHQTVKEHETKERL
jgi:hypothetical protein